MAYPHKWSPISYKSSAGQRKHIGQRPMLYRWTTYATNIEQGMVNFIWFTDEKLLTTTAPSSTQNDSPRHTRRLLRCRPTFSQSLMVSVGVSALPDIRQYSDLYTFQQDGAPAHQAP